jgi:hypothetical protein
MDESAFFNIPLFHDLPRAELTQLVNELPLVEYEPGVYLFREGEVGESLCVVASGSLEVLLAPDTPDEMLLRICGPGEYVGEMSLIMPKGERTASVRAREDPRLDDEPRQVQRALRQWPLTTRWWAFSVSVWTPPYAASFQHLVEEEPGSPESL